MLQKNRFTQLCNFKVQKINVPALLTLYPSNDHLQMSFCRARVSMSSGNDEAVKSFELSPMEKETTKQIKKLQTPNLKLVGGMFESCQ